MDSNKLQVNEKQKSQSERLAAFSEVLATWLLTFTQVYRQEIEELAAMAYRESLKDFSAEQVDRGCRECLKRYTFMPKPAEIIECIRETAPPVGEIEKSDPVMSPEEAKEFFAKARAELAPLLESKPEGIIEITDEMRERHRQKTQEALKRFGGAA